MKQIIPHIYIENCKDAIKYYEKIFNAKVKNIKSSDGIETFKGDEGKYIYAELQIGDRCVIYCADIFGDVKYGDAIQLVLNLDSEEEINRLYEFFKVEGHIDMELQGTLYNSKYAVVTDKYGVTWQLNYTKEYIS